MIDNNDLERLREVFIPRSECARNVDAKDKDIAKMQQDMAVITTKINMLIGILGAIAVPVLAIAIKLLFGE